MQSWHEWGTWMRRERSARLDGRIWGLVGSTAGGNLEIDHKGPEGSEEGL